MYKRAMDLRKLTAELIGTFALVLVGCGGIMVDAISPGLLGHVGVSLAFGLVIMVMIYATGHISGAHFNPAVSVGFAAIGRFRWKEVLPYVTAQCMGAGLASLVLLMVLGNVAGMGGTQFATGWGPAIVVEFLFTFVLMFVITAVATDARAEGAMAGLAIGGTVAMASLVAGPMTGASMNPARSLGPALVAGPTTQLTLYLLVPVVGAVCGAMMYRWIQGCPPDAGSDAGGCC